MCSRSWERAAGLVLVSSLLLITGCSGTEQSKKAVDRQGGSNVAQVEDNQTNPEIVMVQDDESSREFVHINQLGFRPDDRKAAVVNGQKSKLSAFEVIDSRTGEIVYKGQMASSGFDLASGDRVYYADFSDLTASGRYYVNVPGYGISYSFDIDERVYRSLKNGLLKGLYYQRCGIALDEKHAGQWKHDECHTQTSMLFEDRGVKLDTAGGWHDAGDYGRYVSPAANTLAHMLLAFEMFPNTFDDTINIPESGNEVPDILNEARFEVDWLFKMQDSGTGGAYHKVSSLNFCGFIMPEQEKDDIFVMPVSPTATGDFAAIMAVASRIYKNYDAGFSQKALAAAKKAWKWIEENPDAPGFKNPPGVGTGEYGDHSSSDEFFWAAVELYRTTGDEKYHRYVKNVYNNPGVDKIGLGWQSIGGFGTISYLRMDDKMQDEAVAQSLKDILMGKAVELCRRSSSGGYRISLEPNQYGWGSNMGVANNAILLLVASELQPNPQYVKSAQDHLSYLLGCNPLGQSYITGFGSKPIMYPHHRPSHADGVKDPVPGLVSGGPNRNPAEDALRKAAPAGTPPARSFVDDMGSYSSNEIAIYWNSPVLFIAGYFDR